MKIVARTAFARRLSIRAGQALLRPIPFVLGWRNMAIVGTFLGLLSVTITVLLEPFGTADYRADWRLLRLSGYALCFILPCLLFHGIDRWCYRLQGKRWYLLNELISRSLLIVAISTANWLYNIRFINSIQPTFEYWLIYQIHFSLPTLPIFLPIAILLVWLLAIHFPERPPGASRIRRIRGQGREENLTLSEDDFVFAEAQQNYVSVHWLEGGSLRQVMLRLSLSELERQIPAAVRVHRSFLVNPAHVQSIRGNQRKRQLVLHHTSVVIPISATLDIGKLKHRIRTNTVNPVARNPGKA